MLGSHCDETKAHRHVDGRAVCHPQMALDLENGALLNAAAFAVSNSSVKLILQSQTARISRVIRKSRIAISHR